MKDPTILSPEAIGRLDEIKDELETLLAEATKLTTSSTEAQAFSTMEKYITAQFSNSLVYLHDQTATMMEGDEPKRSIFNIFKRKAS